MRVAAVYLVRRRFSPNFVNAEKEPEQMKKRLRQIRENLAAISVAVRASHEFTRAAGQTAESRGRDQSPLAGIPI